MAFKILVNSRFGGGAELQAELLARALKPDAFLVLDGPRGVFPESLSQGFARLPGALKTLLLKYYASRLAAQCGPGDTVLSFMQRSNFVNVLAARKSGHRAVICEVTQPSREFTGLRGRLMKPLIKELYPEAPLVLANSKGNARDLEENFDFLTRLDVIDIDEFVYRDYALAFAADVDYDFILADFDYFALDYRALFEFGKTAACQQFFHYAVRHLCSCLSHPLRARVG